MCAAMISFLTLKSSNKFESVGSKTFKIKVNGVVLKKLMGVPTDEK